MTIPTLSDEAKMLDNEPLTALGYGSTSYTSYTPLQHPASAPDARKVMQPANKLSG